MVIELNPELANKFGLTTVSRRRSSLPGLISLEMNVGRGQTKRAQKNLVWRIVKRISNFWYWLVKPSRDYQMGKFLERLIAHATWEIEADPCNAAAYANRAMAKGLAGFAYEAIEDCAAAIRIDPNNSAAYNNRAVAEAGIGKLDDAVVSLNKAIELEPKSVMAYVNRAMAKRDQGFLGHALQDYREALKIASFDFPARNEIENSLVLAEELNRLKGKERDLWRACCDFDCSYRLFTKGKNYREAIAGFLRIAETTPLSPLAKDAAYNAACGFALLGSTEESVKWLDRAVDMGWMDARVSLRDPDLSSLRPIGTFKQVIARMRKVGDGGSQRSS